MQIAHALSGAAIDVTAIGLNSLWEGAIVIACVWAFVRVYPRLNAATRYVVWSAALVAAVILPIATTLPFLTTSPPAAATPAVKALVSSVTRASAARVEPSLDRKLVAKTQAPPDYSPIVRPMPRRLQLALPLWLAIVAALAWTLVAIAGLVQLAVGLLRLERLKRDALPLPIEYRDVMARWNAALKGHRDVRLCVSDAIDVPVAVGLFDSMILIPRALLERLSSEEIDQIALHELAHLRRADDWTNGLQRIVLALFGWNPAIRFATGQLDLEREVACDDYVLSSASVVRPYAMCLAKMAESSSWPRRPLAAPAVFATRKHLSLRIERLLAAGRATGTHASIGAAAFALAAVCSVGVGMAAIAPAVVATSQTPSVVRAAVISASHPAQAVREIVRYVDVPRTVEIARVAPASKTVLAGDVPSKSAATARPPAPAHSLATAHAATQYATPASTGPGGLAIHVPAIRIPAIDVNVAVPKVSLGGGVAGGRTCSGCDERGMDLRGKNLRGVTYTGVDLSKADLDGADLSGGTFTGVDFSHARLRGASFRNARLIGCDFSAADLANADFTGATVSNCEFAHAKLFAALVRSVVATCSGCDFAGSMLGAVDLSNIHATQLDFSNADLAGANLSGSSFVAVAFSGAKMAGAVLADTTFAQCDLSDTGLRRSDLAHAKLIETDYPDEP